MVIADSRSYKVVKMLVAMLKFLEPSDDILNMNRTTVAVSGAVTYTGPENSWTHAGPDNKRLGRMVLTRYREFDSLKVTNARPHPPETCSDCEHQLSYCAEAAALRDFSFNI